MPDSSDSDYDLPHPSTLFSLESRWRPSINKESDSSATSTPSKPRCPNDQKRNGPPTEGVERDCERRSSPRLRDKHRGRSTIESRETTGSRRNAITARDALQQTPRPDCTLESERQKHIDLAHELFPPSPPSLPVVSFDHDATERRQSCASIVPDSDPEGEESEKRLLGGREAWNRSSGTAKDYKTARDKRRDSSPVLSDSEGEAPARPRPIKTPRARARRSMSFTLDSDEEEARDPAVKQAGAGSLVETFDLLKIAHTSSQRPPPSSSVLTNPGEAFGNRHPRGITEVPSTPRASRTDKQRPKRRITISVMRDSSASDQDDDDDDKDAAGRCPIATQHAERSQMQELKGQHESEEIVVVETDDEEEDERSILPVLEPEIKMNGASYGDKDASGRFGYKGMDDVWENDGVLVYDPTPKRRPARLRPAASPSPFLLPASNRLIFDEVSPSPPVTETPPDATPRKAKLQREQTSRVAEIDLTGSSSSEEDGPLSYPARPSQTRDDAMLLSTPRTATASVPSSTERPIVPRQRETREGRSASPSKQAGSSVSLPPPTPTSKTPKKSKATPSRTVTSTRALSATERTQLPLSLIRQIDKQVFRKKWSDERSGLKCLDTEGEYNGPGLPQGLEVVWNARLRNTAGRARWKKVKSSSPSKAGPVSTTVRHECTIELSSKVIDTELKLRNTLAHELCHIAAWILSGEIRPPHGGAFKLWANRIMKVLLDVEITTTHSYEIAFKFRWRCSSSTCGKIFGRHSNSINVDTHGCPCGSKLVRIDKEGNVFKPKQGGGGGATTVATVLEENDRGEMVETPVKQKKKNGWLEFVASQSPVVRKERPDIPQSEVFKVVAERWKVVKEERARESTAEAGGSGRGEDDRLAKALSGLRVG